MHWLRRNDVDDEYDCSPVERRWQAMPWVYDAAGSAVHCSRAPDGSSGRCVGSFDWKIVQTVPATANPTWVVPLCSDVVADSPCIGKGVRATCLDAAARRAAVSTVGRAC